MFPLIQFLKHHPVRSATQLWLHTPPLAPEPPACSGWCLLWWRSSSRLLWLQDQGSWTRRLTCRCDKPPPQTQPRRLQRSAHTQHTRPKTVRNSKTPTSISEIKQIGLVDESKFLYLMLSSRKTPMISTVPSINIYLPRFKRNYQKK